jgi:four helix bundle protein
MHNYKELKVWQKSIDLTVNIYKISMHFPDSERFNLTSQSRRCSVSISSNIAEGAGRNSKGEFAHFLGIASGSSYELETQMIIAQRLGYLDEIFLQNICSDINEIQKMIFSLQNKVKQG